MPATSINSSGDADFSIQEYRIKAATEGMLWIRNHGTTENEGVKRIIVETWNELYEGTGICRSREYDDAYIALTRFFADIWHDGVIRTDLEQVTRDLCQAITGSDLPPEIGPPFPSSLSGIADLVFALPDARLRHPARISATNTTFPMIRPDIDLVPGCVQWYIARGQQPKYLPVTVAVEGTDKFNGHAHFWMKFYPYNHEVNDPFEDEEHEVPPPYGAEHQRWKVFTGSWGEYLMKGGANTQCVLVEIWKDPASETVFGCMLPFDPRWPYYRLGHYHTMDEEPPPARSGWNGINWMSRPWGVPAGEHPNVCKIELPASGTIGIMLVNVLINPFLSTQLIDNSSCVIQMGGSYLESGNENETASWVHLERTMEKLNAREGIDLVDYPRLIDPQSLPVNCFILRPIVTALSGQLPKILEPTQGGG